MIPSASAMSANIRPAAAKDYTAVSQLLKDSSLPLDGVPGSLEGFLVAESDGAVVGVAGLESCCDNALLRSVAVRPEWRSRGLGRSLVERIIAEAEGRGIHGLYLLTTTAEHYFPSFGFTKVAREAVPEDVRATEEFRSACPASATAMALSLAGARS
jgi:N-acetylglutamate synthase-like GNAT family acetyltransferase